MFVTCDLKRFERILSILRTEPSPKCEKRPYPAGTRPETKRHDARARPARPRPPESTFRPVRHRLRAHSNHLERDSRSCKVPDFDDCYAARAATGFSSLTAEAAGTRRRASPASA